MCSSLYCASRVAGRLRPSRRGPVSLPSFGRSTPGIIGLGLLLGLAGVWLLPATVMAAPACKQPFRLCQPDGTVVIAQRGGDEWFNWVQVDGQLVDKGADGFWRHVEPVDGVLKSGSSRVGLDPVPAKAIRISDLRALRRAGVPLTMTPGRPTVPDVHRAFHVQSAPSEPLLVLLVDFTNRTLQTTDAQWTNAFFGTSGKTVRTYYEQVSRQAFRFVPASETYGTANDGVVRVHLAYPHPNPGNQWTTGNDQIARDAILAADPYVSFAAFDTDHNGAIATPELHIAVIVAGYEAAGGISSPSIWGHFSYFSGNPAAPTPDGVTVGDWYQTGGFVEVGELVGTGQAPIGPVCHEFGHDMGLPDLYDPDGSSEGVGIHCLMGDGSWGMVPGEPIGGTPILLSAWCRTQLGWVTPVAATSGMYNVVRASDPVNSNILRISTSDPNQYFLLENRQLSGFDAGLYEAFVATSGGGIAIWHIDESVKPANPYEANIDETHKKVALEEANLAELGQSELDHRLDLGSRAQYYYAGHVTRFDDTTTPSAHLYSGAATGICVSDVSDSGDTMSLVVTSTQSPEALPDFAITSIRLDPESPVANGTFGASVTVTNQGNGKGNAGSLRVWIDRPSSAASTDVADADLPVGNLGTGESTNLTFTGLVAGPAGTRTFRAFVDSTLACPESDENNNQAVQSYKVQSAAVGPSPSGGKCGEGLGLGNAISLAIVYWMGLIGLKAGRRPAREDQR